jgi:NAD+-dependent protein deacetylase sirtuin 5
MLPAPKGILYHIPKFHQGIFRKALLHEVHMASIHGPRTNVSEFHEALKSSKRIMALCGAGLSAASGLGTFRGAGGMWRNHQATSLATPGAFEQDPGLVWLFYSYRRHKALKAKPNAGHYALAELSRKMPHDFITLTQNVDGTDIQQLCLVM